MITIQLDPDTEEHLDRLVEKTGRSKTRFARAAILEYIEEFKDVLTSSLPQTADLRS